MLAFKPNLEAAAKFLNALDPDREATFCFQTFDDSGETRKDLVRVLHGTLEQRAQELANLNARGAGVFVAINETKGPSRKAADVTRVRAVFADFDDETRDNLSAINAALLPHIIVESSPGKHHAYWLTGDLPLDSFRDMQTRLIEHFGSDKSVKDLSRVMRLPGFVHGKNPAEQFTTRLIKCCGALPYTAEQLAEAFPIKEGHKTTPERPESSARATPPPLDDLSLEGDLACLRDVLARLPPAACDEYRDWITVGMVCHHETQGHPVGFELWDGWSKQSGKYNAGLMRSKWESFAAPVATPLTIASLEWMAGQADRVQTWDGAQDEPPTLVQSVDVAGIFTDPSDPPAFIWGGLIPRGEVTLLAAHGGTGKSLLALLLQVLMATGAREFLGRPLTPGRALFVSGEDGTAIIRHRLGFLCRKLEADPVEVAQTLSVVDITEAPEFYVEEGRGLGVLTPVYNEVAEHIRAGGFDLVVLDNASDLFAGKEIERHHVRRFIRALRDLVRPHNGAALLLSHVDKSTQKQGAENGESYSGSTAWNNSVRSRLFMTRVGASRLVLRHEKSNHGAKEDPLSFFWPQGQLPDNTPQEDDGARELIEIVQINTVVGLLSEFAERGEWASTKPTAHNNAFKLLRSEKTFPRDIRKAEELAALLRVAERQGLIHRDTYTDEHRKPRERWMVGPAPSAPSSAPSSHEDAESAEGASSAPSCVGGVGGERSAKSGSKERAKPPAASENAPTADDHEGAALADEVSQ